MGNLAQEKRLCSKCGAELVSNSAFCSSCGSPVSATGSIGSPGPGYQVPPTTPSTGYGRREKQEKGEKHEKQEKQEKGRGGELAGPLIGGGILIWLGTLVYLQTLNVVTGEFFGGYFLMGIGVLLALGGLVRRTRAGNPMPGFIIGGTVLVLIGLAALPAIRDQLALAGLNNLVGPLILVFLGLVIIMAAVGARRRSPRP